MPVTVACFLGAWAFWLVFELVPQIDLETDDPESIVEVQGGPAVEVHPGLLASGQQQAD